MLIENTDRITETAIPVDVIAPFSLRTRARASLMGFRPLSRMDLDLLLEFYAHVDEQLGDLNPTALLAWQHALDIHLLVEDGVLYLIASWEGGPMLWGPPVGTGLRIAHVRRAFQLLHELDPENSEPVIAYLWEAYPLWDQVATTDEFVVVREGTEYIYDTDLIASLAGRAYKKKRKDYVQFQRAYNPTAVEYSDRLAPGCLGLLEKWKGQKSGLVAGEEFEKLQMEYEACRSALNESLPLTGVVALIDKRVCAFSIGAAHGRNRFNCLFEKTDLNLPQAPAFIFSELARQCRGTYSEITLGEDWHVDYLVTSKRLWKPVREQRSYYLRENLAWLSV